MSRYLGQVPQASSVVNQVPVGGIAAVLRSGDAYKAVGEVVSRAAYPELSAAFPRNGSFSAVSASAPEAMAWRSMAFGNGVYVAVGGPHSSDADGMTTWAGISYDGKNWTRVLLPLEKFWQCVTFGNGLFVAFSSVGNCVTSPDGINWTVRTSGTTGNVTSVTYGAGLFVAVIDASATAITSPDGITWTARTMPTNSTWIAVIYAASKFVAIASGGNAAATSADGITWTARTIAGNVAFAGLAYGAGLFVAVGTGTAGEYGTSPDGITWTARKFPSNQFAPKSVLFGNGVFLAFGSNTGGPSTLMVMVSYDGLNWRTFSLPQSVANGIGVYNAGQFVIFNGNNSNNDGLIAAICYAENLTDSDYLYLSGTAGQFVRVK